MKNPKPSSPVGTLRKPRKPASGLFDRVAVILEQARTGVVRSVNSHMVIAYWLIGREIVFDEQGGQQRAGYGEAVLDDLSDRLTERYGRGYSVTSLKYFRTFYQVYEDRDPQIRHEARDQSASKSKGREPRDLLTAQSVKVPARSAHNAIHHELRGESSNPRRIGREVRDQLQSDAESAPGNAIRHEPRGESTGAIGFSPDLSWTHYRSLMRVENKYARSFYEVEAISGHWSTTDLDRQINSLLFERLLKSRDKKGIMELATKGMQPRKPIDILKDPFVLEFADLPESPQLVESDIEQALVDHMREFLLELGCGFAFVARQQRLTLDGDHYYVDLVFYHTRLKCYVLFDLKVGKLTHQDLGQMQLYVNYYDREIRARDDKPTAGIILCSDRNEAMVRYTLPKGQDRIFAARYRTALPSEEKLLGLLRRDWECVVRENSPAYGEAGRAW